jgi:tRNA nucleotidyltransferase (CCA-adding enzyme)
MLVGGGVRDFLIGLESKDFDLEVYGLAPNRLREVLESIAPVNTVGEQFAVYKLAFPPLEDSTSKTPRIEVDVSIPRRESKSGVGHRGFLIEGDPAMSFDEAARRRDFTVNAILQDPLTGEIVDPTGGVPDLKRRVLRAVAAETFVEDSLRVLRAMQLAARFEMTIDEFTVKLCGGIDLSDLPHERIWGEFEKLLMRAARPSIGLQAAFDLLILDKLFPEVRALVGCPQEPEWHPEGDVFTHTKLATDQAAGLAASLTPAKRITVMLGTLCHDLGKPLTTQELNGRIRSRGHDEAGLAPAEMVLDRLGLHTLGGYDVRAQVIALVREHLRPGQFYRDMERASDGAFRRLSRRVDLELLYLVAKADALGRGPGASSVAQDWFIERAKEIGVDKGPPPPLLLGRHLMEAGFEPGPGMGEILRRIYELQLDGKVTTLDEALDAARTYS